MDIRATFLPVGVELIDSVFPTSIVYIRNLGSGYDPSTGEVTQNTEQFSIKAGVLSRARKEEGGVAESYMITLWVHHDTTGLPHLPKTGDVVEYDSTRWTVTEINPTYSSEGLIASKIMARAE